jgi:hypothetical protein
MLAPVIIVGCGGSGVLSARFIRDEVKARLNARGIEKIPDCWQYIGIDTVRVQADLDQASPLPAADFLSLTAGMSSMHDVDAALIARHPVGNPNAGYEELIGWRPNPEFFPGDPGLGAGKYRAIGRTLGTFSLNTQKVRDRLEAAINASKTGGPELIRISKALDVQIQEGTQVAPPIIIVIGSSAGGTGAGTMIDVIDVIKRIGNDLNPMALVYGPDIFGEKSGPHMAANGLMFMSELLNSYYSTTGGKTGLFPAPLVQLRQRGPQGVWMVGRRNMTGMDLHDAPTVYRAVALAIAGWTTSGNVRKHVHEHVIGNWNSAAIEQRGGFGFAKSKTRGMVSSFGSASLSVGRSRFKSYARAFLMRNMYEHHSNGFLEIAAATFGADGSRGPDAVVINRIVDHHFDRLVEQIGLIQKFDEDGAARTDRDGQITDVLFSRGNVQAAAEQYRTELLNDMPKGEVKGSDSWRRLFSDKESSIGPRFLRGEESSYAERQNKWTNELAARFVDEMNLAISQLTLPVVAALVPKLLEHLQSVAAEFRNSADQATTKVLSFKQKRDSLLQEIGSSNASKDSQVIKDAAKNAGFAQGQETKRQIFIKIAQLLDQVGINLIQPVRGAISSAQFDVAAMAEKQYSEAPVISAWPVDETVPSMFTPTAIEFLLEDHKDWPGILRGLLAQNVEQEQGESVMQAVRRSITVGTKDGNTETATITPLLWLREGSKIDFSSTSPLSVTVAIDQERLEDRVVAWLDRPGRSMSRHLAEGLQTYLQDPDKKDRIARFSEMFDLALTQSMPLMQIDEVYANVEYPNTTRTVQPVLEKLPFPTGHAVRDAAEQLLRNRLSLSADTPIDQYFGDANREGIIVSNFLTNPIFPGMVTSFTTPVATFGSLVKDDEGDLRAWLSFKRGRTLDEVIPLPEAVTAALIRGFAVGRALGLISIAEGAPITLSTKNGSFKFPHPSYAPLSPAYALPALLLSMPLAFMSIPGQKANSFAAYKALFELGVPTEDLVEKEQYSVRGELQMFIEQGTTSAPVIDEKRRSEMISDNTSEGRIKEILKLLDDNISSFNNIRNKELTGKEFVGDGGALIPESTLLREIASLTINAFGTVREAVASFGEAGSDPDKPRT